mmetsp:Transcript_38557/g.119152  ORF Transcript_38557/g.119152 Transcript_38557/m.119152 type:complete len:301 (-) Transcript_38557:342-1244(-)
MHAQSRRGLGGVGEGRRKAVRRGPRGVGAQGRRTGMVRGGAAVGARGGGGGGALGPARGGMVLDDTQRLRHARDDAVLRHALDFWDHVAQRRLQPCDRVALGCDARGEGWAKRRRAIELAVRADAGPEEVEQLEVHAHRIDDDGNTGPVAAVGGHAALAGLERFDAGMGGFDASEYPRAPFFAAVGIDFRNHVKDQHVSSVCGVGASENAVRRFRVGRCCVELHDTRNNRMQRLHHRRDAGGVEAGHDQLLCGVGEGRLRDGEHRGVRRHGARTLRRREVRWVHDDLQCARAQSHAHNGD